MMVVFSSKGEDINGDGVVNVSDYIGVANHIMGNTPTSFNISAADVNRDGAVDTIDAAAVVHADGFVF